MNWEAAGLFFAKSGFLLSDALIAVLITALTGSLITAAVTLTLQSQKAVHTAIMEMEDQYEAGFMNVKGCELACGDEADPS